MKFTPLMLAALLQVARLCPAPLGASRIAGHRATVLLSWLAGAVLLLGGYDTVSGASAAVSGLVKYDGTTPVGSPTNYVVEPAGQAFRYRITVTNPGVDVDKNYFNCVPLPPGLTINTNLGAAGYITGTPTTPGDFNVTLIAGNLNYPTPATLPATIVIFPPDTPPAITVQPSSRSVLAGTNVTFAVAAAGSLPLHYQWLLNDTNWVGDDSASLTLANVTAAAAGDYRVLVTNAFGSITSAVARLTIREPFLLTVQMSSPVLTNGAFHFDVVGPIYTNFVIWRTLDLATWIPIQTNWVIDGFLEFSDPTAAGGPASFYRASLAR